MRLKEIGSYSLSKVFTLLSLFVLTSCESIYLETISSIRSFSQGNNLITDKVLELKYASLMASINDGQESILILAYDDNDKLTWVSADNTKIIMKYGKVVETIGLNNNINTINFPNVNSIFQYLQSNKFYDTNYFVQFSNPFTKLLSVKSTFKIEDITEFSHSITKKIDRVFLIKEEVTIDQISWSYTNYYWVTAEGDTLRSKQMIAPSVKLRFEVLKRYK